MTPHAWRERPPVDKGFQINIGTKADLGALKQTTAQINQTTQAQRDLNAASRSYTAPKVAAPAPAAPRTSTLPPTQPAPSSQPAQAPAPAPIRNALLGNLNGLGPQLLGSLGAPLSVAGAITGMVAGVRAMIEHASEVKDLSEQLQLLPSELKEIGRVASEAGLPISDFAQTLSQLRLARRAAGEGDRELQDTFARFGVSVAAINDPGLRAIDLLQRIGKSAKELGEADLTKLRDLLGRRSDRVAASLSGLSIGVDAEVDKAIESADRFGKFWERMGGRIRNGLLLTFAQLNENIQGLMGGSAGGEGPQPTGVSQEERDFRAWKLDQAAIQRGELDPEEASAGYMRREAFNTAFADSQQRGVRLRYDTFLANQQHQADQVEAPAGMFEDRVLNKAQLELDEKRRKLAFDMLTDEQKKTALAARRVELEQRVAGEPDKLRNIEAQSELEDVKAQQFQLNNKPGEAPGALPVNAWERLGASFGAGGGAADMTRNLQQQTARNTQQLASLAERQLMVMTIVQRAIQP